jgi:hypothetical protein
MKWLYNIYLSDCQAVHEYFLMQLLYFSMQTNEMLANKFECQMYSDI